jgi:pyrimidine operon attenuation protein/uracil phosphoribosyltransferase
MEFKSYIMDSAAVGRALARISHEIVERNPDEKELYLVGIMRKGAPIADVLAAKIREIGTATKVGYLDTTLYRDDIGSADDVSFTDGSKIDFSVTDKTVIMVDDVLCTGRTARAAMDALISMGRPAKIQLAALIDRGHRELPIVADYVGKNVPTSRNEKILVRFPPIDDETSVSIWQK